MALADSMGRPARCSLVNVTSGESFDCLFNPPQLEERIEVRWSRLSPLGLGHQVLQYESTGSRTFGGVEFYVDRFFASAVETDPDVLAFATFMRALTQPPVSADTIGAAAPPRVLVVWPNVVTIETVVTELDLHFTDFARDGSVLLYTATCSFEQILDVQPATGARA